MKRWTFRILLFLFLGVVTTVGVAWGLACWGSYRFDGTDYFSHLDGRQWKVNVSSGLGVTRVGRVPNNGVWGIGGNPQTNREVIPYWSVARDRPPIPLFDEDVFPTASIDKALRHGRCNAGLAR